MGCFNDLPKDVIWLIFRAELLNYCSLSPISAYQEPFPWTNTFSSDLAQVTCNLALLSKRCLNVIKTKTVRPFRMAGWLFKKGALTNEIYTL